MLWNIFICVVFVDSHYLTPIVNMFTSCKMHPNLARLEMSKTLQLTWMTRMPIIGPIWAQSRWRAAINWRLLQGIQLIKENISFLSYYPHFHDFPCLTCATTQWQLCSSCLQLEQERLELAMPWIYSRICCKCVSAQLAVFKYIIYTIGVIQIHHI